LDGFWNHINWDYVSKNFSAHNFDHIEEQMGMTPEKPLNKNPPRSEPSLYH
jgi:hypothetical protein